MITVQSHESQNDPVHAIEHWDDELGNTTSFARLELGAPLQFMPDEAGSGFRHAVEYVAEATGMYLPDDRYKRQEPVIMAIHGSTVELYDGRRKSSRWYDLRQIEKGEYAVTTTGKMSKETMVSFDEGDFVYLGIVAGKMGEQPTPELPGRELYRKVLSATTEQRNRRIARAFPWAK